jgi:hypothetical protein
LHKGRLLLVSGVEELLERYPVDAVEIELDPAGGDPETGATAGFLAALKGIPWVASVKTEGRLIRIMVQNVPDGKRELVPLIAKLGVTVNRYEWIRPSLEDIFLQMSS